MTTPTLPELLRITPAGASFITMQGDRQAITAARRLSPPRKIKTARARIIIPNSYTLLPATLVTVLE